MGSLEALGSVALGVVVIVAALLDVAVTALHPAAESLCWPLGSSVRVVAGLTPRVDSRDVNRPR